MEQFLYDIRALQSVRKDVLFGTGYVIDDFIVFVLFPLNSVLLLQRWIIDRVRTKVDRTVYGDRWFQSANAMHIEIECRKTIMQVYFEKVCACLLSCGDRR